MAPLYQRDLAYIHARGFEDLAREASPEIIHRLRSAAVPVRHVVDVGCGAGALTRALLDAGFEVTGIDPSNELLALARVQAPGARYIHGSVYEIPLPTCDAIVAVGEPLTYHDRSPDAEARTAEFFQHAWGALSPGGLLMFDLIEGDGPSLTARTWRSGDDWAVLAETVEERGWLTRSMETFVAEGTGYRRGSEVHCVRIFDTAKIEGALKAVGFEVQTSRSYGARMLAPRRRAFFCRLRDSG